MILFIAIGLALTLSTNDYIWHNWRLIDPNAKDEPVQKAQLDILKAAVPDSADAVDTGRQADAGTG